ncbi:hypothetical protein ACW2Q0_28615 [Nocardia sp. R16R-3T]
MRREQQCEYPSPLIAMEDYLGIVCGYGTPVNVTEGESRCAGIELPIWNGPEIDLGMLRPGTAGLIGRLADWAITRLTPVSYLRGTLRPVLAESAASANRP